MTDDAPGVSYEAAIGEVEEILEEIESAELPIDALAPKVERAAELIRACRSLLEQTELRVTEAVAELASDAGDGDEDER